MHMISQGCVDVDTTITINITMSCFQNLYYIILITTFNTALLTAVIVLVNMNILDY